MSKRPSSFVHWLVQRLYKAGTRRLFGVPGGGTSLALIDAAASEGIESVSYTHLTLPTTPYV